MKLPTALATSLAALGAGAITISEEVKMSHPAHQAVVLAGAFLISILVHLFGATEPAGVPAAPPYEVGVSAAAPAAAAKPLAPADRTLP